MLVPTRHGFSNEYRYGFQGQEKDDEIKEGDGNSINYKYRMHDPRVGRFFATDPLSGKYPYYTPYSFSGNKVIDHTELEGLEDAKFGTTLHDPNLRNASPEAKKAFREGQTQALIFSAYVAIDIFLTKGRLSMGYASGNLYESMQETEKAHNAKARGDQAAAEYHYIRSGDLSKEALFEVFGGVVAKGIGKVVRVASKFNKSGSKLISSKMLEKFPESETFGKPLATFIAPSKEIDDLLSKGLSRKEIAKKLGINDPNFLKGDLIRIDIDDMLAKELNIRKPKGNEAGANSEFIEGGKTSGGVSEAVVDGIPKTDSRVKITVIEKVQNE